MFSSQNAALPHLLVGGRAHYIEAFLRHPAASAACHILLQRVEHLQQTFLTAVKVFSLDLMVFNSR